MLQSSGWPSLCVIGGASFVAVAHTLATSLSSTLTCRNGSKVEHAPSWTVQTLFSGRRPGELPSVKYGYFEAPLYLPLTNTLLFSDHWDVCGTTWVKHLCEWPAPTLLLAHDLRSGQTTEVMSESDAGSPSNYCGLVADPARTGAFVAADSLGQRVVRLIPTLADDGWSLSLKSRRPRGGANSSGSFRVETIADSFDGLRLDAPDDVAVRADGTVYFSDLWFPQYGVAQHQPRQGQPGLYSIRRDGVVVAEDRSNGWKTAINGVALSPDETRLYVTCTFGGRIDVFDVASDTGALSNRRVALSDRILLGFPDGLTVRRSDGVLFVGTNMPWVAAWDPATGAKRRLPTPLKAVSVAIDEANETRIFVSCEQGVLVVAAAC